MRRGALFWFSQAREATARAPGRVVAVVETGPYGPRAASAALVWAAVRARGWSASWSAWSTIGRASSAPRATRWRPASWVR